MLGIVTSISCMQPGEALLFILGDGTFDQADVFQTV